MWVMSKRAATETVSTSAKKVKSAAITSFFKKDGVSHSSTPRTAAPSLTPDTPFDKSEWVTQLEPAQKELLALEIDTLHESWLSALHQELTKPYFLRLKEYLAKERKTQVVFPPDKDIYSWSRHTPLDTVKVVIIGQDPYHNVNQAHGLCFSVQSSCPAPPSLKNIYKALKKDYPTFTIPQHGSLLGWADQGVLLLNTCLTVRAHQANSHQKQGWEQFTQKILDVVAANEAAVFMAWGKPASERVKKLDVKKHLKLESVHPSPLSAARGFFDCRHFVKANEWITQKYGVESVIDWDCLATSPEQKTQRNKQQTTGAKQVPKTPGLEDEVGQVDAAKPAAVITEDSFGISPEEEELMAAAQDQVDSTQDPQEQNQGGGDDGGEELVK